MLSLQESGRAARVEHIEYLQLWHRGSQVEPLQLDAGTLQRGEQIREPFIEQAVLTEPLDVWRG